MANRRGFLFGAIGALAAPSIVRAESLMKLWVPETTVLPLVTEGFVPTGNRLLTTYEITRRATRLYNQILSEQLAGEVGGGHI